MMEKIINFLKELESTKRFVYPDSGGAPTIGTGHLLTKEERRSGKILIDGVPCKYKHGLTYEQCDKLLIDDLKPAFSTISWTYGQKALSDNQITALTSFVFNVGAPAFQNSTLLKMLNAGRFEAVPDQMRRWKYDNGKVVQGLINRREKEIDMWLS